ncbi:MAG: acetylglutamate kinase [Deltaproteobacteria bacterium]|nr:acetylglutamate kinase [Deltaproteobacteria bacterium]
MSNLVSIKTARKLLKEHNLSELRAAINYINAFSGKRFVLKIGGSVLNDLSLLPFLVNDLIFLKKVGISVVLVHGGSRQLNLAMTEKKFQVQSIRGLRVTSADVLELAAIVFFEISHEIKNEIEKHGYHSQIFGRETGLVKSAQIDISELGFVGVPRTVEVSLLNNLADNVIPIVSSVTAGTKPSDIGFNVNADDVAGIIASKIKAEKLILMTDVDGVLDENGTLLSSLTVSQVEELIEKKVIHGGMIPKVATCLNALKAGVQKCHIVKGSTHSFIEEILTDEGVGTEFVKDGFAKKAVN